MRMLEHCDATGEQTHGDSELTFPLVTFSGLLHVLVLLPDSPVAAQPRNRLSECLTHPLLTRSRAAAA